MVTLPLTIRMRPRSRLGGNDVSVQISVRIFFGNGWAGQDSNLQPDRYERPALTVELPAPAGLHRDRVTPRVCPPPVFPSRRKSGRNRWSFATPQYEAEEARITPIFRHEAMAGDERAPESSP